MDSSPWSIHRLSSSMLALAHPLPGKNSLLFLEYNHFSIVFIVNTVPSLSLWRWRRVARWEGRPSERTWWRRMKKVSRCQPIDQLPRERHSQILSIGADLVAHMRKAGCQCVEIGVHDEMHLKVFYFFFRNCVFFSELCLGKVRYLQLDG